ncbi:MAG TPA: hypothetical protein VFL91_26530 [Thermomicrobiales bacterium]|nr:hypothetical protein [Thermomicrobiales bacterium]
MQQIVLGETVVVWTPQRPRTAPGPSAAPGQTRALSFDQARALADSPIWQPTYLPSPGLLLDRERVGVDMATIDRAQKVLRVFLKYRETPLRWLVLSQTRIVKPQGGGANRLAILYALQAGSIANAPAAFFSHTVSATALPAGQQTIVHCLWERAGFLMQLQAPQPFAGDLVRIGEGLA